MLGGESCDGAVDATGCQNDSMRMEAQAIDRSDSRAHESLVEFYRVQMMARYVVNADALIRRTAGRTRKNAYSSMPQLKISRKFPSN